jgi:hypothetical protein
MGGDGIQSRVTGALLERLPSVGAKRHKYGLSTQGGSTPAVPVEDDAAISSTPGPGAMLLLLF